jgi:penicillin G amidase
MRYFSILLRVSVLVLLFWGLHFPIGGALKLGPVLDSLDGVWGTARSAKHHVSGPLKLDGMLDTAEIEFDERGVPHIFASSDQDAIIALGYLVAQDRLFQMDFIHRAATGTLSELLGASALSTDRFFRRNGITDAVNRNSALLPEALPREFETVQWYGMGVDAYLRTMNPSDIPLEYKILGSTPPTHFKASYTMALLAFMTYDLSFQNQDVQMDALKQALGEVDFETLYPQFGSFEKTIILPEERHWPSTLSEVSGIRPKPDSDVQPGPRSENVALLSESATFNQTPDLAEGFFDGKGSNNWAVDGSKSASGMPILAGDMHLGLSLPAIWYEAHLVTPTANVYGVTFPSVPGIVEGITPTTAWAFTNTGSDQLDTYRLKLNEARDAYLYDGQWIPLTVVQDTMQVKGGEEVVDTRFTTHLGPVLSGESGDYAIKWVGHEFGTTFAAVWDMNRATDYSSFEQAIRKWDYPMQNILYAGSDSVIAIRSTGYMPIRAQKNAFGVQDGTTSSTAWVGRIPFDELPHAISPKRGFLTSTNQRPAPEGYPYYLDSDWRSVYRSIRIYNLLSGKEQHSADDLKRYQADVVAVQAELFLPLIRDVVELTEAGERFRSEIRDFDGNMDIESTQARLFGWFMDELTKATWDEDVFEGRAEPKQIRILDLIADGDARWFDRTNTPEVETLQDVLAEALDNAGARWAADQFSLRPYGEDHSLVIRHITRSDALKPLWKGPYPFPGYAETLSPAMSNPVYFSASWRVVADFSTTPPTAFGVYPGGQSGNPFSANYDAHIGKYVAFEYYPLDLRSSPLRD